MAQILDLGKIRFNWAGTYSGSTEYEYNDLVKYGPNLYAYTAVAAATGVVPTNTSNWTLATEGVSWRGTYVGNTLYYVNDLVTDGITTYIVTTQHTSASTPVANEATELSVLALGQASIPPQGSNVNKVLSTDGTDAFWANTLYLSKTYTGSAQGQGAVNFEDSAELTDTMAVFGIATTDFGQLALVNTTNAANASTDIIAYTADGSNNDGWIDLGITSATFDAETYGITGPHDGYIFMSAPRSGLVPVTLKRITAGVARLTLGGVHTFTTGDTVKVEGVGAPFDGIWELSATTTNTISWTTLEPPFVEVELDPFGSVYKPIGAGNLVIATDRTGSDNNIIFAAGGFDSGTSQMTIHPDDKIEITIETESTSNTTGAFVVAGGVGMAKNLHVGGDAQTDGMLFVGPEADEFSVTAALTDPIAVLAYAGSEDSFAQVAIHNSEPTSSTDILLYADNGDDETGWIDMGVTGSEFSQAQYGLTGPNDGYIFYEAPDGTSGDGNLVIATGDKGSTNAIIFGAGGFASGQTQMAIYPGVNVHIDIPTPSTSPTTGALTVIGGVGIQGDVNIAGAITFGGAGTQLTSANLTVTDLLILVGNSNTSLTNDLSFVTEGKYTVPAINAVPVNKSLTSNVATITTFAAHGFLAGDSVTVGSVDATFNGTYTIVDVPTTTTFTYAKTAANVTSTAIGDVTYSINNKVLTSNVATLTTSATHNFVLGETVTVTGVDSTFNGTYTIVSPVTGTTFSYTKVASNVASTAVSPVGTATVNRSTSTAQVASPVRTRWSAVTKRGTTGTWNFVSGLQTKPAPNVNWGDTQLAWDPVKFGAITSTGAADIAGNFAINTNKFNVTASSGNTTIAGTLGVTGDVSINTNKFNVTASSGNTTVAGTLGVTGDVAVNTNKFTVAASTGNTAVGGTLSTAGLYTASAGITVPAGQTLTVAGTTSLTGTTTVSGDLTVTGKLSVQESSDDTNDFTVVSNAITLDYTAGNVFYYAGGATANWTLNLINVPTTDNKMLSISIVHPQGAAGYYPSVVNVNGAGTTLRWAQSTPVPTSSSGKIDIFTYTFIRRSSTWTTLGNASLNY